MLDACPGFSRPGYSGKAPPGLEISDIVYSSALEGLFLLVEQPGLSKPV